MLQHRPNGPCRILRVPLQPVHVTSGKSPLWLVAVPSVSIRSSFRDHNTTVAAASEQERRFVGLGCSACASCGVGEQAQTMAEQQEHLVDLEESMEGDLVRGMEGVEGPGIKMERTTLTDAEFFNAFEDDFDDDDV